LTGSSNETLVECCTTSLDDFCLTPTPRQIFWVCSYYSGGYDYDGWVDYGNGLASAWNPPPPVLVRSSCFCSPRSITANDTLVNPLWDNSLDLL
jgi:hypothetical protein